MMESARESALPILLSHQPAWRGYDEQLEYACAYDEQLEYACADKQLDYACTRHYVTGASCSIRDLDRGGSISSRISSQHHFGHRYRDCCRIGGGSSCHSSVPCRCWFSMAYYPFVSVSGGIRCCRRTSRICRRRSGWLRWRRCRFLLSASNRSRCFCKDEVSSTLDMSRA